MCTREDKLAHYSDKLAHVQVVIHCQFSEARMCTREDKLAHYLGTPFIDDTMSHNTLITVAKKFNLIPISTV